MLSLYELVFVVFWRTWASSDPGVRVIGLLFHLFCRIWESADPGARVVGFTSHWFFAGLGNPQTLAPWLEDCFSICFCRTLESSHPGARVGWLILHWFLQDLEILRPWRQGYRIDFPFVFAGLGNPPTLAPGLADLLSIGFYRTWESSDPDAMVWGLIFNGFLLDLGILPPWSQGCRIDFPLIFAKTNGKSILQPWRQGRRSPKSCRTWESPDPGARVVGLIFHWFLQDLRILRPWRQGWMIDFPLVFAGLGNPQTLAPGLEDWFSICFCMTWGSSDPGAMVGWLIFHWFLQDLGILSPWRQGRGIDFPLVVAGLGNPPTLAPGLEDWFSIVFLQDLGILRPWRQGPFIPTSPHCRVNWYASIAYDVLRS